MIKRWKIIVEYNGVPYSGWQRQEVGIPSVQQAVEDAIRSFCQQDITIHVAGRTDAGVHARGQVAHFDLDYGDRSLNGYDLVMAINAHLKMSNHAVAVLSAEETHPEFHARFNAKNKLYCYRVLNRVGFNALESGKIWHIRRPLNVNAMRDAAKNLLGQHDFTTFRDSDCQAKSPIKTLDRLDIDVLPADDFGGVELHFMAEARSFLHHQVRNMVGTLVLVGEGKWIPDNVKKVLEARDRTCGGPTAPPDGLYLMRIDY